MSEEMPDEIYVYKEECKIATGLHRTDFLWREKNTDGDEDMVKYHHDRKYQALLDENKKLFKALENATLRPYEERDQLRAENKAMREALQNAAGALSTCYTSTDSVTEKEEQGYDEPKVAEALTKINQVIGGGKNDN